MSWHALPGPLRPVTQHFIEGLEHPVSQNREHCPLGQQKFPLIHGPSQLYDSVQEIKLQPLFMECFFHYLPAEHATVAIRTRNKMSEVFMLRYARIKSNVE